MEKIKSLKELSIGNFVKVSETGGPVTNRLAFSGEIVVLDINSDLIEVKTFDGIIGLKFEASEYPLEIYKLQQKPNGWDEYLKNPKKFNEPEIAIVKKTKKEQIYDLVKQNHKKSENKLLSMAKKQIGGDETVLLTYIKAALQRFK